VSSCPPRQPVLAVRVQEEEGGGGEAVGGEEGEEERLQSRTRLP
jgi:hypothetical protein